MSLAVGEAYMDGTLVIDGPLDAFTKLAEDNVQALAPFQKHHKYKNRNRNVKANQRKQIAHHYDIGNDFYSLWLDKKTLTYTCAYYKTPKDSLEKAQTQKIDHILRKLRLKKGQTLLDIGCGWGYLLIAAAKQYGVKGVGVTLSKEQLAFAQARAKDEGVSKLVVFRLMNYQDLPKLKQRFDRVVSVGFLEAVGEGNLSTYFKVVQTLLVPGGTSVLHSITSMTEHATDAWLDRYIFPGGYVPSAREVTSLIAEYGFEMKDYENLAPHYALTLREWWKRFEANKEKVIDMFDERFYRMWRLYLVASATTFEGGTEYLSQWIFIKPGPTDYPLTRDYIYKK